MLGSYISTGDSDWLLFPRKDFLNCNALKVNSVSHKLFLWPTLRIA